MLFLSLAKMFTSQIQKEMLVHGQVSVQRIPPVNHVENPRKQGHSFRSKQGQ